MRIFYTENQFPVILDSIINLNRIYSSLKIFLESEENNIRLNANVKGNPAPYNKFLPFIEFIKLNNCRIAITFSYDKGLVIKGDKKFLVKFIQAFQFKETEDCSHHHPIYLLNEKEIGQCEIGPIIEADNEYIQQDI